MVVLTMLQDLYILAECDYLVLHLADHISRMALSLATVNHKRVPPYVSMEGPWCHHWRLCCDVQRSGRSKVSKHHLRTISWEAK